MSEVPPADWPIKRAVPPPLIRIEELPADDVPKNSRSPALMIKLLPAFELLSKLMEDFSLLNSRALPALLPSLNAIVPL